MLKTMMENESASFANISIPFLRLCSQHMFNAAKMISGKRSKY